MASVSPVRAVPQRAAVATRLTTPGAALDSGVRRAL